MNMMREAIDTTTLGWIKPELDETLRHARQDIEAFAETPADTAAMRSCAAHLHQVAGTLQMVELTAPAMVASEMEALALALQQGAVVDRDEACSVLMRGVVQLPDYLERLQGGHRDIPVVLLPLLNELRAARGVQGIDEAALFVADLARPLPDAASTAAAAGFDTGEALAALHGALATWTETDTGFDAAPLHRALDALLAAARHEAPRRMFWVAASVAAALRDGAMPAGRGL
ncbi:MAG TPA: Hpt domain-containing protein, partial [Lysobacter sp.]